MIETKAIEQMDPEELKSLIKLRDTRMEVLQELGREEGIKEGQRELILRMHTGGISTAEIAKFTGFTTSEIEAFIQSK